MTKERQSVLPFVIGHSGLVIPLVGHWWVIGHSSFSGYAGPAEFPFEEPPHGPPRLPLRRRGRAGRVGAARRPRRRAGKKPLRVGLIGTGWYGKCSLFRLIQVAPVEVVALCDVDKKMLAEAADLIGQRTKSDKKPRLYGDYREMLKEKDLDVVMVETPDHWHALPMIAASRPGPTSGCRSRSAWT